MLDDNQLSIKCNRDPITIWKWQASPTWIFLLLERIWTVTMISPFQPLKSGLGIDLVLFRRSISACFPISRFASVNFMNLRSIPVSQPQAGHSYYFPFCRREQTQMFKSSFRYRGGRKKIRRSIQRSKMVGSLRCDCCSAKFNRNK